MKTAGGNIWKFKVWEFRLQIFSFTVREIYQCGMTPTSHVHRYTERKWTYNLLIFCSCINITYLQCMCNIIPQSAWLIFPLFRYFSYPLLVNGKFKNIDHFCFSLKYLNISLIFTQFSLFTFCGTLNILSILPKKVSVFCTVAQALKYFNLTSQPTYAPCM